MEQGNVIAGKLPRPKDRIECDECHKTFGLKKDLVRHIKSIHEKEEYTCERCHKTFNSNLRRHQVTCNGRSAEHSILKQPRKPVQSQEDSAATPTPASANRAFECEQCDKSFGLKHNLVTHIKSIHGEESHKCERCPKKFNRIANLRRHESVCKTSQPRKTIHVDETFVCGQCDKSFELKHNLVKHVKSVHSKESHKCERCLKSFSRNDSLRRHQVICKLNCPRCEEQFIERTNLVEHMKLCPALPCDICKDTFESKTQLKKPREKTQETQSRCTLY